MMMEKRTANTDRSGISSATIKQTGDHVKNLFSLRTGHSSLKENFKETQEKALNGTKQRRDYIKSIYIFIIHQLHVLVGFSYSIQIKLRLFLSLS